jgi:hypothetical protein
MATNPESAKAALDVIPFDRTEFVVVMIGRSASWMVTGISRMG